jgi:hypothetical protein
LELHAQDKRPRILRVVSVFYYDVSIVSSGLNMESAVVKYSLYDAFGLYSNILNLLEAETRNFSIEKSVLLDVEYALVSDDPKI